MENMMGFQVAGSPRLFIKTAQGDLRPRDGVSLEMLPRGTYRHVNLTEARIVVSDEGAFIHNGLTGERTGMYMGHVQSLRVWKVVDKVVDPE